MDERTFARLAARLRDEPVVLASVLETRGAVPRERGARMLIGAAWTELSVGGGAAEARVIDAARTLLARDAARAEVAIDLSGRAHAQGVCGGAMRIGLERWDGPIARERAATIAQTLAQGRAVALDQGTLAPNVRLLIVGGGHCAAALHDLAALLEFDQVTYAARTEGFDPAAFPHARTLCGEPVLLEAALETARVVYAVLLNRDYEADVAALRMLARRPPRFIGMMGSKKRIATVAAALPEHANLLSRIQAPVGIELDAQTPHEIAVSILAQLIAFRRQDQAGVT